MLTKRLFISIGRLVNLHHQIKRCKHRQTLSRMFPMCHGSHAFNDKTPEMDSAGSLSSSLMQKHKLILNASKGTHYYMPSLTRSLEKLIKIIDREMKDMDAQKIVAPCLSPKHLWEKSDRWDLMDSELFKVRDRSGAMFCLSPTHEEAVTSIVARESPITYKRLPIKLYQIGKKFRDEMRHKHGLLRNREFEMKDLYTFDASEADARKTFDEACRAYSNILAWLDLPFTTVEASTGNMGGSRSTEFHLISNVGEDQLYKCNKCGYSLNGELIIEKVKDAKCSTPNCEGSMQELSGIEVAHAFILDTKYSDAFGAKFIDQSGNKKSLVMGCYGVGVSRLLASSIEVTSTADQLRYSPLLAPFQICLVPQKEGHKCEVTWDLCQSLYDRLCDLTNLRDEVVIDDRLHLSIGRRIKQASEAGFPFVIALGKQALDPVEPKYELIDVYKGSSNLITLNEILCYCKTIPTVNISI